MKLARFMITAVVVGMSGPAFAQAPGGISQPTATNPPVNQAATRPAPQVVPTTSSTTERNWVASGYIGANFGSGKSADTPLANLIDFDTDGGSSFNFGAQIAYLGRGVIGGEFLMDFSPGTGTLNNILFESSPDVNSYMFNLIAVAPFGHARSFDPYISGGIGAVSLNATIFTVNPNVNPLIATSSLANLNVGSSRFGWDLGGGLMAWTPKNWGFRGDVRYYKTSSNENETFDINNLGDGSDFARLELSGLSFWKANAGIAFRW
jgi:hypothetical protein